MKKADTKNRPWVMTAVALATLSAITSVAAADYASTVSALGPVAYYRLNNTNTVPAEVPAANLGSLGASFGGEYQSMALARGQQGALAGDADAAVSIAGAQGQQIVVPYSAAYNPSGPFTIEFWAKPAAGSTAANNHTAAISMVNGQNPTNGDDRSGWCVRHSATDWQFILGFDHPDGTTYYHTILTAPLTATEGTWQHVVAVYTPARVSLYVNGVEVAGEAPTVPIIPNTFAPLILGDRGYTGWDFDGLLDEFAIYPTALSATDIQAHYNNGLNANRTTAYQALVLQSNPALYFRLNEPKLELPLAVNNGSLGSAGNGTYFAGATPGLPGLRAPAATGFEATNAAAGFNGVGGSVQIPGLNLNTDALTMVCWLKRDGTQHARAGIMHNRKVTQPEVKATGLGFHDDGLALSYTWEDLGESYNFNPGFVPPDQTWTFFAVTVAADAQVMYMGTANGLVAATNTLAIGPHDFSGTTLELGWDNYQATRVFRGSLDEFAMFDKTLSHDEVTSLYNAALPSILALTRTPADPVYEGSDVTFQTTVAGTAPITYQWRKGGTALAGKTAATLSLSNLTKADAADYDVVVTTGGKTLTSPISHLEVLSSPPVVMEAPKSAVRFLNGTARFSVVVRGTQPMTYQWKRGTEVLAGATSATLDLSDLRATDAGNYTVVITNPFGTQEASATLTLVTPTKYSAAAVDAGPVGYWRLDETTGATAYDYWGGLDGYATNGATNNAEGPRPATFAGLETTNRAYTFPGNASAVVIPPLNLNKATVTIVAWIKPNGDQDDFAGIVFARGTGATGLDLTTEDQLGYHWNDTADSYNWQSGLVAADGVWNFVALVVKPDLGTMYLDDGTGLRSSENTVTHAAASFADPLRIGVDSPGGGRGFKGLIDEVTIYDRALSAAEIGALRAAGFAGTYSPTPVTFIAQPKSQTIMAGASYSLSARVSGSTPLSYQWQKNGQDIPGAIRSSLSFNSAVEADTGAYQLVVSQGTTQVKSATATLTVKPVPTHVNLPENLVMHLKFDGDYQDASGRNNHGSPRGSPQIVAGKIGSGALRYNTIVEDSAVTAANYVTLDSPEDLKFGSGSFSVSFWTKFTGNPGDLPFLCNNEGSYGGPGFTFAPSWETGSWSWSLNDNDNPADWPGVAAQYGNEVGYANALNDGNWHHLAFLVDRNGDLVTYLNGAKAHAKSLAGLVFNLDTPFTVDIGQAGGNYAVAGDFTIDDLGIWRSVLTEYDVQAIYLVGNNYGRSFDTAAPPEIRLQIKWSGSNLEISWPSGTLESASSLAGPWATVSGATAPSYTVTPSAGPAFYRAKQ